ncbi:hypothetical protein BDN72DRAFT_844413 [Pluteus cervinus]|uniref:Uncharacterized protein n=1 Tax=Pluteus cervinus TaxID=181527 RepID=A0ACD3AKG9_9AGAR|nr:hypothetical protein BDN72DRAFT_844413 [Pluteus cervinus]
MRLTLRLSVLLEYSAHSSPDLTSHHGTVHNSLKPHHKYPNFTTQHGDISYDVPDAASDIHWRSHFRCTVRKTFYLVHPWPLFHPNPRKGDPPQK